MEGVLLHIDELNPSYFRPETQGNGGQAVAGLKTDNFPVESVSWYDAIRFCNRLSELENKAAYYAVSGTGDELKVDIPTLEGEGLPTTNRSRVGVRVPRRDNDPLVVRIEDGGFPPVCLGGTPRSTRTNRRRQYEAASAQPSS